MRKSKGLTGLTAETLPAQPCTKSNVIPARVNYRSRREAREKERRQMKEKKYAAEVMKV